MSKSRLVAILCVAAAAAGCTPGAATNGSGGSIALGAVIVHVSLLKYAPQQTQYGKVAGYSPNPIVVAAGSTVQFVNDDNFSHTASSVGQSGFPSGDPISNKALNQSGTDLSQANWSTGSLAGGAASQALRATVPGTYYFGCFYHYATPMRGVIIVQ